MIPKTPPKPPQVSLKPQSPLEQVLGDRKKLDDIKAKYGVKDQPQYKGSTQWTGDNAS